MSVMEQNQSRPRTKSRTFSFKSDKSHGSSQKHYRESLRETEEEKHRSTQFTTKANPNAAMNEAQPIAAALEAPTIGDIRAVQHTDRFGNPITEPDLSNPTRPRWERPLDTIRAFEAAIDTEYKRRSVLRADSSPGEYGNGGYNSRRSSYYGGHDNPRYSQAGGYYGNRAARDGYLDNSYGAPPAAGPSRNRYGPRMYSEPNRRYSNAPSEAYQVYPTPGYQQSRDTVNTGDSSSSEPWANNTNPSSDGSGMDRHSPSSHPQVQKQPDLGEQYGFNGFGGAPIMEEGQAEDYFQGRPHGSGPPVPPHSPSYAGQQNRTLRKPVNGYHQGGPVQPLGNTTGNTGAPRPQLSSKNSEKRKSWFKRRFSGKD